MASSRTPPALHGSRSSTRRCSRRTTGARNWRATIGEAIQRYSHQYRRPRGVYLSIDAPGQIETALRDSGLSAGEVDLIVATDAQAILGIGDWGVGGIEAEAVL